MAVLTESMMVRMKERVTISLEPEALEVARAEVEAGNAPNLSAAIEAMLLERKRLEAFDELLAMFERHHGRTLTDEELKQAEEEITRGSWVEET
jgi:hypothetical protein